MATILAKSRFRLHPLIIVPNIAMIRKFMGSLYKDEIMGKLESAEVPNKSINEKECLKQGKRKEDSERKIDNQLPHKR